MNDLETKREHLTAKMQAIMKKAEDEFREPTPQEQCEFDACDRELERLSHVSAGRKVIPQRGVLYDPMSGGAIMRRPQMWQTPDGRKLRAYRPQESLVSAYLAENELPGGLQTSDLSFGRYLQGVVTGKFSEPERELIRAAGSTTSNTSGAHLIPDVLSRQWIDLARANSVMVKAGAVTLPFDSSTVTLARVSADPSVQVKAENASFTDSGPTFEACTLTAYTLGCYCRLSNELAADMLNGQLIETILARALAAEVDKQCLAGTGSAQILGITLYPNCNAITSVGSPTYDDIVDALKANMDDNGVSNAAVYSPATWSTLNKLKKNAEANNYTAGDLPQAVKDLNHLVTTAIGDSYGVVGDFTKAILGLRQDITVQTSTDERFAQNQLAIRATMRGDLGLSIPDHFCVLSGIS